MHRDRWDRPEQLLPLEDGEVQVWRVDARETDLTALERRCLGLLNPNERSRAERYRVDRARTEFVVARASLRVLLGAALKIAPEAIAFQAGPHGKPELALGPPLRFNVAHSHGVILIALCRQAPVGIDVERMDGHAVLHEIAEDSFTAREQAVLREAGTREQWLRHFYQIWTQKEAVTKADGRGLTLPLPSFDVPMTALELTPVQVDSGLYGVVELSAGEGFAAALAVGNRVGAKDVTVHTNWLPSRVLPRP